MKKPRFNEVFNHLTYAAALATVLIVGITAIDWCVMYFGMVN